MKLKHKLAAVLGVLVLVALLATSFVSARPQEAVNMDTHFQTIPGGSTHSSYNGDYITSDRTIPLYTGWTENLPQGTCAIAVRFAFKDNAAGQWAALRPSSSGSCGVLARIQVANQYSDDAGIVPIIGPNSNVYLDISSAGYVFIEIVGFWRCTEYQRPTLTP